MERDVHAASGSVHELTTGSTRHYKCDLSTLGGVGAEPFTVSCRRCCFAPESCLRPKEYVQNLSQCRAVGVVLLVREYNSCAILVLWHWC